MHAEEGGAGELGVLLAAAGRTVDSLPPDMRTAFSGGTLAKSAVQHYLALESNWFTKIFMPIQGAARHIIGLLPDVLRSCLVCL
jgi:hypothetical protein